MPNEFERLIPEFLTLARRIYDAGVRAERDRLLTVLQSPDGDQSSDREPKRGRAQSTAYGSISAPVREALIELVPDYPDGIGAADLAAYFERQGSGPNEKQVRAALKLLLNTGEANRVSRGRYLPRTAAQPQSEEEPGGDAPGPIDFLERLAAEQQSARKAGGT
jgi:hypothetical protein